METKSDVQVERHS